LREHPAVMSPRISVRATEGRAGQPAGHAPGHPSGSIHGRTSESQEAHMKATLQRMREKRAHGESGFTLIELLVVVVIIGVLVAIAIPVYMNYRKGAADKSAQSDVRGAVSAIEQFYTDNGNTYPVGAAGV